MLNPTWEVFGHLKKLCPIFTDKAVPLANGDLSLVVDMGDGTLMKFYKEAFVGAGVSNKEMKNEAENLLLFKGHVGDFQSPILVDYPARFDADNPLSFLYSGYIRITKLPGVTAIDWDKLQNTATLGEQVRFAERMGALVASIHHSEAADVWAVPISLARSGKNLQPVWEDSVEFRERFRRCHQKLMQMATSGFAHADLAPRNVMMADRGFDVTGVVDFALSGLHSNQAIDFVHIPDKFMDHVLRGYEAVSGKKVEPVVVHLTHMSHIIEHLSVLSESRVAAASSTGIKENLMQSLCLVERLLEL